MVFITISNKVKPLARLFSTQMNTWAWTHMVVCVRTVWNAKLGAHPTLQFIRACCVVLCTRWYIVICVVVKRTLDPQIPDVSTFELELRCDPTSTCVLVRCIFRASRGEGVCMVAWQFQNPLNAAAATYTGRRNQLYTRTKICRFDQSAHETRLNCIVTFKWHVSLAVV